MVLSGMMYGSGELVTFHEDLPVDSTARHVMQGTRHTQIRYTHTDWEWRAIGGTVGCGSLSGRSWPSVYRRDEGW